MSMRQANQRRRRALSTVYRDLINKMAAIDNDM